MLILSKIFTILVMPPGCIIALLLLFFFFVPNSKKFALFLITTLLYALSIQPVSDFLLRPLEDAYPPLAKLQGWTLEPQAIVVLGGGTVQNSPEAGAGRDTLSADAMKRLVYAFTLRDTFPLPYIFSGGRVFDYDQASEAETAGRLFAALGLDNDRFFAETESRNTWENAKETAKRGYKEVLLVTSAYHMRRSVFCFQRNGMAVIPAPTDYKIDRGREYDFLSYLPTMEFLRNSYLALHEYVGLVCYRILYRG